MNEFHHALLYFAVSVREHDLNFNHSGLEVIDQYYEKFGIDDVRSLVKIAHNKPRDAEQILLIVRADFITHEAQNALLKILEEPPVSTRFVFVLPTDFLLLPTLLSRFSKETFTEIIESKANIEFEEFLSQSYGERISSIEKAIKKKDTKWQRSVKQGLIEYLKNSECNGNDFKNLEYTVRKLLTRGASNKMLFENAALILKTRS